MDKYIIVFCEGDHDVAFLSRILLIDGFIAYDKKVKDFIQPLNKLYIGALKEKKIEDSKFKFKRANVLVPYAVFQKEETLVIFHNLGGDGNILNGTANKISETYLNQNDEILREAGEYKALTYRFLYFLDADDEGITTRVTELNDMLKIDKKDLEHCSLITKDNHEIGCCIFHDKKSDKKTGKLENILLDLMPPSNEKIFESARKFITEFKLEDYRQKKFICTNIKEKETGKVQFRKEKSIISIAGQLQFSGSSNSVIIANSDYIQKKDILDNYICTDIITLFQI